MSGTLSGAQAATAWLESIEMPPEWVPGDTLPEGVVRYPEGEVRMPLEEYVALYLGCEHQLGLQTLEILLLRTYLEHPGFWGSPPRQTLAPVLRLLAVIRGRTEFREVRWER